MYLRAFLASLTCAGAALASDGTLPARFDSAETPLAIRAAPAPDAAVLGHLQPGAQGVQVIARSADGAWGQIAHGEGDGWAAHGRAQPPTVATGSKPATALLWGGAVLGRASADPLFRRVRTAEHPEMPLQITGTDSRPGADGPVRLWTFAGETATASLLVRHEMCSDGMSDRPFGLSAAFTMIESTGAVHLRLGCCALTGP